MEKLENIVPVKNFKNGHNIDNNHVQFNYHLSYSVNTANKYQLEKCFLIKIHLRQPLRLKF